MSSQAVVSAIGIIILAAGSGKRFGSDKRMAVLPGGKTLLETTLASIPAIIERRMLVLKPGEDALASQFSKTWEICFASNPDSGMASSLVTGISAADSWEGALIGLADMPFIKADTYTNLQRTLNDNDIVVPTFNGKRGNPVGFRKHYFQEILAITGDQGARRLLDRHQDKCKIVETGDEGVIRDIDSPESIR